MRLDYLILCYKELEDGGMSIIHACGYPSEPKDTDWNSLRMELATDEEFGLIGDTDYEMLLVSRKEDGNKWFEDLGLPETFEELEERNKN